MSLVAELQNLEQQIAAVNAQMRQLAAMLPAFSQAGTTNAVGRAELPAPPALTEDTATEEDGEYQSYAAMAAEEAEEAEILEDSEPAAEITREVVTATLKELRAATGSGNAVRELLTEFGAEKIGDLKEADYAAVVAAAAAAVAAA